MTIINLGLGGSGYTPVFIGDTGSGGVQGLVPAPPAGSGAAGYVLKADGSWGVAGGGGSSGWQLAGNGSLSSGAYFGTSDASQPLVFKANAATFMTVTSGQAMTLNPASFALTTATVTMPNLPSATSANVLYYNAGVISQGLAPSGSAGWSLSANTLTGGEKFGSLNTFDVAMYANNVEIARLVQATGAFQVHANATIAGSIPAAVLTGSSAAGTLVLTSSGFVSGEPEGGTVALGGPSNAQFPMSVVLISPSNSGTLFISDITSAPYAGLFSQGLVIGKGTSSHFGNATDSVLVFQNQTSNPTTSATGFGTLYVGSDNNLHFLNNTTDYALTPPSGGGGGWNLSGTNSGGTLLLGTNDTTGFSIRQNSIPFIMLGTGILAIATNTAITTFNIGNTSASTTMDGTSLFIPNLPNTTTASVLYYNSGTGRLSFGLAPSGGAGWNLTGTNSGSGLLLGTNTTDNYSLQQNSIPFITLATAALSIATNTGVTTLTIGSSVLVTAWSFNGLSALGTGNVELGTASGNADFGTMAGTATFNGTSVQVKADGGNLDLLISDGNVLNVNGSGGSAGTMNIATNLIGTLNIGAVATTTSIDGTHLYTPNLFSNTTSNVVFYDISTKQLSYGPAGSSSSAWLTTGNSTLASGAYLGVADTSQPLLFKTNNTTFLDVDSAQNATFTLSSLLANTTTSIDFTAQTTAHFGALNALTIGSGLSVQVTGPDVFINETPVTNTTTIGNALTGNNININSADLYINNLQSTPTYVPTTSMQVMIDVGASNIAYLTAPGWSTGGDAGVTGGKLGTTDAQSWQMIVDNFAFFTVTSAVDITFGGNTFHVALANGGNSISFFNNYDNAGSQIILAIGVTTPSSITLLPDSLSAVAKGMTFTSSTDDIAFISSAASISSSSVNTYHNATTAINQVAPTFNFGITTVNTNINIGSLTTTAFLIQGTTTTFTMGSTCTFSTGNFNLMSTEINLNASTFLNMSGNVASIWTFTDTLLIDVTQTLTIGSNSGNLLLTGITGVYIDGRNGVLALGNLNAIAPGPGIYTLVWTQSSTFVGFGPLAVAAFEYALATSTSQAIVNGIGYVTANPSLITFSLPSAPNLGTRFQILGDSGGPWTIQQNALQSVWVANSQSTVGVGGSVSSQAANGSDCIVLVYTQNGVWRTESSEGNFVIV